MLLIVKAAKLNPRSEIYNLKFQPIEKLYATRKEFLSAHQNVMLLDTLGSAAKKMQGIPLRKLGKVGG